MFIRCLTTLVANQIAYKYMYAVTKLMLIYEERVYTKTQKYNYSFIIEYGTTYMNSPNHFGKNVMTNYNS